jgi:hypothetical protein
MGTLPLSTPAGGDRMIALTGRVGVAAASGGSAADPAVRRARELLDVPGPLLDGILTP